MTDMYNTFALYDPELNPKKPKRVATVKALNYYKAALKAIKRGVHPQVYVRKLGTDLVKIYEVGWSEPTWKDDNDEIQTGPKTIKIPMGNGESKTITFSRVPKAKYVGYTVTAIRSRRPDVKAALTEVNNEQLSRAALAIAKKNKRIPRS